MSWFEYSLKGFCGQLPGSLLHPTDGAGIFPTHWVPWYPLPGGPDGRTQILVVLGTGVVVVGVMLEVETGTVVGQLPTTGGLGGWQLGGIGFFLSQSLLLQPLLHELQ